MTRHLLHALELTVTLTFAAAVLTGAAWTVATVWQGWFG